MSLEAQRADLDRWAEQAGVQVVDHYADPGVSARKKAAKRPGLQRMLADVRAGKIDLIVFTKLDRWFRSVSEYYKVQEVLEQFHVNWRTTQEDYDTSTAAGRLKVNIMLSVAQDEADRTGERIRAVFDGKRQRLEPLTGSLPTGYRLEGKRMVRDPETEQAVETFFRAYLASGSVSEARAAVLDRCRFSIGDALARKMLDNPAYAGAFHGVEGMCPPYVTREESQRIRVLRGRAARRAGEGRVYLFSGLLYCGVCGCRLGGHANSRGAPFYNCPGRYVRKSCPNSVNLSERKIEAQLLAALDAPLSRYTVRLSGLRPAETEKREATAVQRRLERLKELYLNELLGLEEYRAERAELLDRLERLALRQAETPEPARLKALADLPWQQTCLALEAADRRDFWRCLLKEVRLYPDRHLEFDLWE